jgi:hypothetical protein
MMSFRAQSKNPAALAPEAPNGIPRSEPDWHFCSE